MRLTSLLADPLYSSRMASRILYISWEGSSTSYLESLFIPIFSGLQRLGWEFHILHFTWAGVSTRERLRHVCASHGIRYRSVRVVRKPRIPGILLTLVVGTFALFRAMRAWQIEILMPRSVVPGILVSLVGKLFRRPIVYDSDGLGIDEKVDFEGLSSGGWLHATLRLIELKVLNESAVVLARTAAGSQVLRVRAGSGVDANKFFVVSNGRFRKTGPASKIVDKNLNLGGRFTLCYVGSLGPQYLPDRMLAVASALRAEIPKFHFKVLTGNPGKAKYHLSKRGMLDANWIQLKTVRPGQIPDELQHCNLGIALRSEAFSTYAVSPLKIGDYLSAGIPVVGSSFSTITEDLVSSGVFFPTQGESVEEIVRWVCDRVVGQHADMARRSHAAAERFFSLQQAVLDYDTALNSLRSN